MLRVQAWACSLINQDACLIHLLKGGLWSLLSSSVDVFNDLIMLLISWWFPSQLLPGTLFISGLDLWFHLAIR